MKVQIEICANSIESAINAEKGGASRIELCSELEVGGITPSAATLELCIEKLSIPVFVLIRPRSGDFVYSDYEFEIILRDIAIAKELGAEGIVSGVLLPMGEIDIERCTRLIKASNPLPFTFHRAFDQIPDPYEGLETLISMGVQRVLTSGQKNTAYEGKDVLKSLLDQSNGRIGILPGGGINKSNAAELCALGFEEIHLSATKTETGTALYAQKVSMNATRLPESGRKISNADIIREIRKELDELSGT